MPEQSDEDYDFYYTHFCQDCGHWRDECECPDDEDPDLPGD